MPLLIGLLAPAPLPAADGHDRVFFAGTDQRQKGFHYCIELPVDQSRRKTFAIPGTARACCN